MGHALRMPSYLARQKTCNTIPTLPTHLFDLILWLLAPRKKTHNSKPCISNTVLFRQYASNEICIVPTGFAILDFGRLAATKDQKTDRDSYRARQKACNAIQPMPKHPSDLILWLLVLQRKPKTSNYDFASVCYNTLREWLPPSRLMIFYFDKIWWVDIFARTNAVPTYLSDLVTSLRNGHLAQRSGQIQKTTLRDLVILRDLANAYHSSKKPRSGPKKGILPT